MITKTKVITTVLVLLFFCITLLLHGCAHAIADRFTKAPNHDSKRLERSLKINEPAFDKEFFVKTSRNTNISVGIIEPGNFDLTAGIYKENHPPKSYLFTNSAVTSTMNFTDFGIKYETKIKYSDEAGVNNKHAYPTITEIASKECTPFEKPSFGPIDYTSISQDTEIEHVDGLLNLNPDLPYESITIFKTSNNTEPQTVRQPKGTIIILHGLWQNKRCWFTYLLGNILAIDGYRAVLIDMAGHGKSTGKYITYGKEEAKDVKAVIDYLEKENLIAGNLGIAGVSFGGATSIDTAAIDKRIKAVVAVEPYANIKVAGFHFLRALHDKFIDKLPDRTLYDAIKLAQKKVNYDPAIEDPIDKIKSIDAQILLIHGEDDVHIPCQQSVKLHNASPANSKVVILKDNNHMNIGTVDLYAFADMIIDWYDKNL